MTSESKNFFTWLAEELVLLLFGFVPTFKDLGRLRMVCAHFNRVLRAEPCVWKKLCLDYWKGKGLEKLECLEWVQKESRRDWIWFSICFANEGNKDGLCCRTSFNCTYLGEKVSGLCVGWGLIVSSGSLLGGLFNGGFLVEGFALNKTGGRYEGEFREGRCNGYGTLVDQNGKRYEGSWKDGCFNGAGSTTTRKGGHYEGEFRDGCRSGNGVLRYSDGTCFSGEFNLGKMHGRGRMTFPNGFMYDGLWCSGLPTDKESCIDPKVKEYISAGICTLSCTGERSHSAQFGYKCRTCKKKFCNTCVSTCHNLEESHVVVLKEIYGHVRCGCGDDCASRIHDQPKTKKAKTE